MKVITTDGALLNLSRFEAIRILDGDLDVVTAADVRATRISSPEYRFRIEALAGLGRAHDPTRILIAEGNCAAILRSWEFIVGPDRGRPIDLGAVVRTEEARPDPEVVR